MRVPKVSVIVPIYNGENYIQKCIESILNQSYKNLEIIIINDGSTDSSSIIIKKLVNLDKRILYLEQENRGVSSARNKGIDISNGEFITFIDCDDTVEENYIKLLVEKITNDNLDIVTCGYIDISIYGRLHLNDFYKGNSILSKGEFISDIFKGVGGTLWGKIFKREIIIRNNIKMNPDIFICEDMIFVLQYAVKCNSFGCIEQCIYKYNRNNENSVSSKVNFKYFLNLVEVMRIIETILKESKYDKKYIDCILCERIKNLSISFFVMQHNKINNYSKIEKIKNISSIFESEYFNRYKEFFEFNNNNERILIKYIKGKNMIKLYYYSYYVFLKMNIKRYIRKLVFYGGE